MNKFYKIEKLLFIPIIVVVPLIILSLVSVSTYYNYSDSLNKQMKLESGLNKIIVGLTEGYLVNYDYVELIKLQENVLKYSYVLDLNFYDENGKNVSIENDRISEKHVYRYDIPIIKDNQTFGTFNIGYDRTHIRKIISDSIFRSIIMALTILVLQLIFLARVIKKNITSPLEVFLKSIDKIENGNWDLNDVAHWQDNELLFTHQKFINLSNKLNETTINREFMLQIFESMMDFVIIIDDKKEIVFFNSITSKALNYPDDKLQGMDVKTIIRDEDISLLSMDIFLPNEITLLDSYGVQLKCLVTITELVYKGNETRKLIVAKDITDIIKSEEEKDEINKQLMMSSKLASIGELASGVGHEINNPLTVVIGYIRLLKDKILNNVGKDDQLFVDSVLPAIDDSLGRIQGIVKGLRFYSHMDTESLGEINLKEVLSNIELLMGKIYQNSNINLSLDISDDALLINGNLHKMQQIITNLLSNAKDALIDHEAPQIKVKAYEKNKSVNIEIQDNGSGISESQKEKIFDAFFTTKQAGKGTGLGLSLVFSFVQNMNGEITVDSKEGSGTIFHLKFPSSKA